MIISVSILTHSTSQDPWPVGKTEVLLKERKLALFLDHLGLNLNKTIIKNLIPQKNILEDCLFLLLLFLVRTVNMLGACNWLHMQIPIICLGNHHHHDPSRARAVELVLIVGTLNDWARMDGWIRSVFFSLFHIDPSNIVMEHATWASSTIINSSRINRKFLLVAVKTELYANFSLFR